MGTLGSPKTWVPYMNTKDCSQGFCSLYCPQWCYIIFPPPPPFTFPDENSGLNFSPLVIAIIGILASAFLLVSYYAIISKYCGNTSSSRRRENNNNPNAELEENRDHPSSDDQWQVGTNGLDEGLIKSITVFKYKNGDGLIEGTECSVCLSEFQEDESLRLLPKCSHAFHITCIDTWLKSHSNCPMCRANIVFFSASPSPLPPPVIEASSNNESHNEDSGNSEEGDTVIEIRDDDDDDDDEEDQQIRRSVSMGYLCQRQISISDVLQMSLDDDLHIEEVGSSKRDKNRVLHCGVSPIAMKRSFSSGRFLFSKRGRGRNIVIPL